MTADGTLACLDAAKGTVQWKKNYVADFGGKVPTWAYQESVLVDGDKVICVPGRGRKPQLPRLKVSNGDADSGKPR